MEESNVRRRRRVEPASPPSPNHNQPSPQERQQRQQRGHDEWDKMIRAAITDANRNSRHPVPPKVETRQRALKIDAEMTAEFMRLLNEAKLTQPSASRKAEAKKAYDDA